RAEPSLPRPCRAGTEAPRQVEEVAPAGAAIQRQDGHRSETPAGAEAPPVADAGRPAGQRRRPGQDREIDRPSLSDLARPSEIHPRRLERAGPVEEAPVPGGREPALDGRGIADAAPARVAARPERGEPRREGEAQGAGGRVVAEPVRRAADR